MKKAGISLILFITLIAATGCKTAPPVIPDTLHPSEYFQKAQEASSNGKYDLALKYYTTFLKRYPDDIQRGIEAKYEIAFIAYKRHETETAKQLFTDILNKYDSDTAQLLPAWPKILSEKILKEISDSTNNEQ